MDDRVGGLDVMRAAAISLVLIHHLFGLVSDRIPWMHVLQVSGPLGVDMFFALSGFLIGRILLGLDWCIASPAGLVGFWKRRWMRTLPLYYIFLAIHVAWAVARNGHLAQVLRASSPYLWFGQSLASRPPFFFGESWSLAVEEWFYLLFPLAWAGLTRMGLRPKAGYVGCALLMLLVPLGLRLSQDPGISRLWYYDVAMITVYRLDGIAMGVLAAAASLWMPDIWRRYRLGALAAGFLMLAGDWTALVNSKLHSDGFMLVWHFNITGLGCALLLPALSSVRSLPKRMWSSAVSALARWSYGLYLVNALLLAATRSLWGGLLASSMAWSWALVLGMLAASLATAAALHRWIEKPIMDLRRSLPIKRNS